MKKLFFLILFLLIIPAVSNAASIRAVVDRTSMTLEDTLNLTVIINDGKSDIDVSGIKDFKIISKSSGSNYQWINGKTLNEFKLNFILVPQRQGKLSIPPLTVEIKSKTLTTEAISINVTDTPIANKDNRDVFVTAKISQKPPFGGQRIRCTFALYKAVQSWGPVLQTPEFTGFVVKEEAGEVNRRVVVGGRQYNVIEKKLILIPTKKGKYNIPPAVLNCNVVEAEQRRNNSINSLFNDSFFRRSSMKRKILRTNPLTINVKELPAYNLDFNFSGVVGHVTMRAEVEELELKTGDSTTLSITIEGKGNIMDVEEPDIRVPTGFKIYKDNPEEDIKTGRNGYSGKKTFRMALVAVEAGSYEIPVIKFSYFDIDSKKYRMLTAGPFNINITPSEEENRLNNGIALPADAISKRSRIIKKKVEYTGQDLLPLKEDLGGIKNLKQVSYIVFVILLITPLILAICIKLLLVFTQRDQKTSLLMLKRAEISMKKATKDDISDEEFLSNIYKAFISIIFSRASVTGESLTTTEAREILENANYSEEIIVDIEHFIESLESIRFSGEKLNKELRKEFLEKTKKIIRIIK